MNIRVRAALHTAGILGAWAAISVGIQLILKYTPVELLQPIVATVAVGGLVYLMYTLVLGQLQSQKLMDEMNSKG